MCAESDSSHPAEKPEPSPAPQAPPKPELPSTDFGRHTAGLNPSKVTVKEGQGA